MRARLNLEGQLAAVRININQDFETMFFGFDKKLTTLLRVHSLEEQLVSSENNLEPPKPHSIKLDW